MKTPAIPKSYSIYQQCFDGNQLCVNLMGHVRTADEAKTMLQVFNQADAQAVHDGKHTYFFLCTEIRNQS